MARLLDLLTGSPSNEVTVSYGSSLSEGQVRAMALSQALNRKATQLKKSGDFDAAIESMREANRALTQAGWAVGAGEMRLVMLLHKAGRRDEAWGELNRMIVSAKSGSPRIMVPMTLGDIYDKMRLCLQREGRHVEAVVLAVLSFCCRCKGLYLQSRTDELRAMRSHENLDGWMSPLLTKAKALHKLPELHGLVDESLRQLPTMKLTTVRSKTAAILKA